jgi:hypothetical protein
MAAGHARTPAERASLVHLSFGLMPSLETSAAVTLGTVLCAKKQDMNQLVGYAELLQACRTPRTFRQLLRWKQW